MWASYFGHLAAVQALLNAGADVAAKDQAGFTSLHKASESGHAAVVQTLLEHGANVAARDNTPDDEQGSTSLHAASANGHATVVQALLEHGADVAARVVGAAGGRACRWRRRSGVCKGCHVRANDGSPAGMRQRAAPEQLAELRRSRMHMSIQRDQDGLLSIKHSPRTH